MASRKPTAADEPTQTEGRALPAPKEKSARGKKLRPSGQHHLVAEVTASGSGLALREADAKVKPHARHDVPSEVTAGRGVAFAFSTSDEVTAKGAAVRDAEASRGDAFGRSSATAKRSVDTQDETRPEGRDASVEAASPSRGRSAKEADSSRSPPGASRSDRLDEADSPRSQKGADPSRSSARRPDDRRDGSGIDRLDEADPSGSPGRREDETSTRARKGADPSRPTARRDDEASGSSLNDSSDPFRRHDAASSSSLNDRSADPLGSDDGALARSRSGRSDRDDAVPGRSRNSADQSRSSAPRDESELSGSDDEPSGEADHDDASSSPGLADAEDALDDFDDEPPGAPPEAEAVASRALAVAALVQRGFHEARPNNASDVRQLQSWVDAFGLFAGFGAGAIELFDAKHGAWTQEDRVAVAWVAEELRLLLWALKLEPALPSTFERSDAKALVQRVPLLEPPQAFVAKAAVRDLDELEVMRAFYEVLFEAARAELWARAILEEPSLVEAGDEELVALLEVIATDDVGPMNADTAVATLRTFSRTLLTELFAPGSPHAALAFDPGALEAMNDVALANAFAIARTRSGALEWLTEGETWDFDDDDEGAADDEG